jgi:hypothetical protein
MGVCIWDWFGTIILSDEKNDFNSVDKKLAITKFLLKFKHFCRFQALYSLAINWSQPVFFFVGFCAHYFFLLNGDTPPLSPSPSTGKLS